jgi:hypothetical protein
VKRPSKKIVKAMIYSILLIYCANSTSVWAQNIPKLEKKTKVETTDTNIKLDKDDTEWGDWGLKTPKNTNYGIGIRGLIEAELSLLDKSNLVDNAGGVAAKKKQLNVPPKVIKKTKDIKRMMKELEIMEAEVKQEINDETEF